MAPGHRAVDIINARRKAGSIVAVIANGKGGCGKSTLTINMAIGYGLRKQRVLVVDADIEQKTVSKWPRPAGLMGPKVVTWPTVEILDKLAEVIGQYDVVLIDMAGRDDRAAAPVMAIADMLISPAKPSHQDLSELDRFVRVAKVRNISHLVVFNEATREMTGELGQLVKEFARFKPFLPTAIQQLAGYRRAYAFGRGVLEYKGAHPAKENFDRVFRQIDMAIQQARAKSGLVQP
ncbi:AAA family ATPase [Devosia sp. XJ19-1]|uniref:AAA family ATPase n=1 Tax=Devosia ureilytica TaxID=2952754 RepID=A0A9Q4FSD4_9HYPH|nr:division plane positioning ATPase MipZ [Devosia ureilytica]MCP8885033.1 AAA family ATPase [Devosia ureilytica]MCP8888456.1 AAA family ATPase [Devosia ureilytica]